MVKFEATFGLDHAEFEFGDADPSSFSASLVELTALARQRLRLPGTSEQQLVLTCIDPDDRRHPLCDDAQLRRAVQLTFELGEKKVTLEVNLVVPSTSATDSMTVTNHVTPRKSHSAPSSPKLKSAGATFAALAASPAGAGATFASLAQAASQYGTPSSVVLAPFGNADTMPAVVPLPPWSELLPLVVSFFDDPNVQQALRRSAPSAANSLRSGTPPRAVITNLLTLEPAIASHDLTVRLLPSLPTYAPRLSRAAPKLAELLMQLPTILPVLPRMIQLFGSLMGGDWSTLDVNALSGVSPHANELLASLSSVFSSLTVENTESSSTSTAAVASAVVHEGIECHNCGMNPILGVRYRCQECFEYDLCEACEALNVHDASHTLVKLRQPASATAPGSAKRRAFVSDSYSSLQEAEEEFGGKHAYGVSRHGNYSASLVYDVTLESGSIVKPGEVLMKTWALTNDGEQAWPDNVRIVLVSGDHLTNTRDVFPVVSLAPGDVGEASVVVDVPQRVGHFRAVYSLIAGGRHFGERVEVDIIAADDTDEDDDGDAFVADVDGLAPAAEMDS